LLQYIPKTEQLDLKNNFEPHNMIPEIKKGNDMEKDVLLEENIKIRYSDLNFDKSLKPSSLLNFFQDIAVDSANLLGFGTDDLVSKKMLWYLLKYRIEFNEYPQNITDLTLRTEPRGYHRLFAYRNFEALSNNKTIIKASSLWSLVNFETKNIVNIESAIQSPLLTKFVADERDLFFGKIPSLTKEDYQKEFEVRYNDIDGNRHANNGNYIVWALEPLSYGFRKQHKLKTLDIVFKKEIKYGEKLVSMLQFTDKKQTTHVLKNKQTDEDICLMNCQWTNI